MANFNPRTLKALGALLTYPEEPLLEGLEEIRGCLGEESLLAGPAREALGRMIDHFHATDLYDLQEAYIGLFDRNRSLSLHLYEHVHGESRDRGQAMVNLMNLYQFHGFEMDARELPDYLPLVCEFLSQIEGKTARSILADAAHVLEAMRVRLEQRGSVYQAVFAGLLDLADTTVDAKQVEEVLAAEPDDDSLEALDKAWEEEPVTFGPGDAMKGCPMYPRPNGAPPAP